MALGISGLASGLDWRPFAAHGVEVDRAPTQRLLQEQSLIEQRKNAYSAINTQLAVLQNRLTALKDPSLFESRSTQVSDEDAATITAASGSPLGKCTFSFAQLAAA